MEIGSPGPLGVVPCRQGAGYDPSGQSGVIGAWHLTGPACLRWHPNKKGL